MVSKGLLVFFFTTASRDGLRLRSGQKLTTNKIRHNANCCEIFAESKVRKLESFSGARSVR